MLDVTGARWMSDARAGAGNQQEMCSLRLWKNPLDNTDGKAGRRAKGKESREGPQSLLRLQVTEQSRDSGVHTALL